VCVFSVFFPLVCVYWTSSNTCVFSVFFKKKHQYTHTRGKKTLNTHVLDDGVRRWRSVFFFVQYFFLCLCMYCSMSNVIITHKHTPKHTHERERERERERAREINHKYIIPCIHTHTHTHTHTYTHTYENRGFICAGIEEVSRRSIIRHVTHNPHLVVRRAWRDAHGPCRQNTDRQTDRQTNRHTYIRMLVRYAPKSVGLFCPYNRSLLPL